MARGLEHRQGLTDAAIRAVEPPAKRREIPDGKVTGLYLVVQPSGLKSWALRYRVEGAPKKLTIGGYPDLAVAAAREKALEALRHIASGKNPAADKRAARGAVKAIGDAVAGRIRELRSWPPTRR